MAKRFVEGLYEQLALTPEERVRIATGYAEKVRKALGDRIILEQRWERAYRMFEGLRADKKFPWDGASNIHIPIVAIHASAIHARFMTTLFTPEPFWHVRSRNSQFQDFSENAGEYL